MTWETVAQGTSFDNLQQLVEDRALPKGTKIKVQMDTAVPWLFDAAGAEFLFKSHVPEGVKLIDVYGEDGKAYAEMEVTYDSIQGYARGISALPLLALIPLLATIAKWGVVIILAGTLLYLLVSFVKVLVWGPAAKAVPVAIIAGIAVGVIGMILLAKPAGVKRLLPP